MPCTKKLILFQARYSEGEKSISKEIQQYMEMTHELKLEIIKKDGALEQKSNLIEDLRRQLDCEINGLKTYEKGIHTLIIFQHKIIFILLQNNCFQGYTGIILSVHPVYKNLVSVKALARVLSHI